MFAREEVWGGKTLTKGLGEFELEHISSEFSKMFFQVVPFIFVVNTRNISEINIW